MYPPTSQRHVVLSFYFAPSCYFLPHVLPSVCHVVPYLLSYYSSLALYILYHVPPSFVTLVYTSMCSHSALCCRAHIDPLHRRRFYLLLSPLFLSLSQRYRLEALYRDILLKVLPRVLVNQSPSNQIPLFESYLRKTFKRNSKLVRSRSDSQLIQTSLDQNPDSRDQERLVLHPLGQSQSKDAIATCHSVPFAP